MQGLPQPYQKNHENWRISNFFPKFTLKNMYHLICEPKEKQWKTAFMAMIEFCEFLAICTKHSNQPSILLTDHTRKLCITLNGYYIMIGTLPLGIIEELLKMTIPSLGIAKLPHYKTQILLCQGEDLSSMQLINEGISMRALKILLMFEENRSWRMCIGNQAIKISRCLIHWLGMFGSSSIYLKLNLKIPYHQIINENVGKCNTKFHAIARIYELLVLPIEPHTSCTKCHFMGDTTIYLDFIVHENDIIANKEKITTIHELTTPKNIHQEGSC